MVFSKAAMAYTSFLVVLCAEIPEALVPSSGVVSLARSNAATMASRTTVVSGTSAQRIASTRSSGKGSRSRSGKLSMSVSDEHDILLRVARGEKADRAPVWLMRQVGLSFFTSSDSAVLNLGSQLPRMLLY